MGVGGGVGGVGVDSFSHSIVFKKASPTLLKICLRFIQGKACAQKLTQEGLTQSVSALNPVREFLISI